jgi:hypothetical protein
VCNDALLLHCALPTRNTLKNPNSVLLIVKGLYVNEIDSRPAMLGDQDRFSIFLNLRDEPRSLTLKGRNEFGFHGDTIVALVIDVNSLRTAAATSRREPQATGGWWLPCWGIVSLFSSVLSRGLGQPQWSLWRCSVLSGISTPREVWKNREN